MKARNFLNLLFSFRESLKRYCINHEKKVFRVVNGHVSRHGEATSTEKNFELGYP
jgi:hypothetical protein